MAFNIMRLASIVVAYNPEVKEVVRNVLSYSDVVDLLIVWDNTTNKENDWSDLQILGNKVLIYQNGENIGLASAYNRGIEISSANDCTHFMTMDQDSCFENIRCFVDNIRSCEFLYTNIFCPPVNNPYVANGNNISVGWAVQSGCVFPMKLFRDVGSFRDDFFIGMVDAEMQLKALEHGYQIVQVGGCNLIHQVGSGRTVTRFGCTFMVSDYGPLRYYYDSRNRILMWKEFPYDYSRRQKRIFIFGRFKLCLKILLAENKKCKKIFAIIRGTLNGAFNRLIPYDNPVHSSK